MGCKIMVAMCLLVAFIGCNGEQCNKNAYAQLAIARTTFLSDEVAAYLSFSDNDTGMLLDRTRADIIIVGYINKRAEMGQMLTCTDADMIKEANSNFTEMKAKNLRIRK